MYYTIYLQPKSIPIMEYLVSFIFRVSSKFENIILLASFYVNENFN